MHKITANTTFFADNVIFIIKKVILWNSAAMKN